MEKELSIIVFTHRRPDFLLRFLKYYNYSGLKYQLIVGDGGKDKLTNEVHNEIKKNKKIIYKKFNNEFNFKKKEYNIKKFFIRRIKCLDLVNTKYVKFICDDDFLIDYTTRTCIEFLNKNKDYIAAGGSYIDYSLNKKYYGKFVNLNQTYISTSNDSSSKIKRIIKYYTKPKDSFHYVFRTDDLVKIHSISSKFNNSNVDFKYHNFENVVFLHGKTKSFKDPMILHESHNDWHEGTGGEIVERIKEVSFIKNLELFSKHINSYFKLKNQNLIKNLYYNSIVIKELNQLNYKNYHSILDIAKYFKNILIIKYKNLKKLFILKDINVDNFFRNKLKNQIIDEIKKIQNFLKNN
jgi:glycosyltransferase domain-containing protein